MSDRRQRHQPKYNSRGEWTCACGAGDPDNSGGYCIVKTTKSFRVGTFYHGGDPSKLKSYMAYMLAYDPAWSGCVEFDIEALSGKEAKRYAVLKRQAIEIEKARLRLARKGHLG